VVLVASEDLRFEELGRVAAVAQSSPEREGARGVNGSEKKAGAQGQGPGRLGARGDGRRKTRQGQE